MGWLRQMMTGASPPYRSYDALAESALADPGWPPDYRPQPRSLAAIFSKLDREIELEWLVDRPEVQQALSQLLGRALPDFRQAVGRRPDDAANESRRVKLRDARFARALDLLEEDLPPGIPLELREPSKWLGTWWYAPSGAGRSLVGRWLAARGRATFIRASNWSTAQIQIPREGAVFVELTGFESGSFAPLRSNVCVAAGFRPASPEWVAIDSPPAKEYVEALVDWLGDRLPGDGRFDRRDARAWLQELAAEPDTLDSVGTVLGLCGLMDELGKSEVTDKSLQELGRHYFRTVLGRAAKEGSEDANWL